ncbi:EF-hand domain-containing protein [Actinomadura fulvescens]|uniref:EF-hand domain-containing protein n=1 Tax=Actinomadura fulvescens TaxID=46160 RepID=A0ABN3Q2H1_9ACTN
MSSLRQRKYRQWFLAADVDGDGTLTRRDATLMSERFISARGAAPDSPTAQRLNDLMDGLWIQVIAPMDRDGDGTVDLDETVAGFEAALADRANSAKQIKAIADHYFELADANGDGTIDFAEFRDIFGVGGRASEEDCAKVFHRLDRDGNGSISHEEYHQAVEEFFFGDDPDAPGNDLFGKLAA